MLVELEVLDGLAAHAQAETARAGLGYAAPGDRPDRLRLSVGRDGLDRIRALRTVVAAYSIESYPVPRPRGLLGEAYLRRLTAQLGEVVESMPAAAFESFRIDAAGSDSSVFQRLAAEISARCALRHDRTEGALLLRVRPAANGWEVAARLTPRPLSARAWRVRDVPGALNATIAAAMVEMTKPRRSDRFLNLLCGSGTLLVERLLRAGAVGAVGLDSDPHALEAAAANLGAAGLAERARLLPADVAGTGLPPAAFDALAADLPYGERSGSHAGNRALYAATLAEAARLAIPGAPFVLITHDVGRFRAALAETQAWAIESESRVFQGGYRPRIWLLRRAG